MKQGTHLFVPLFFEIQHTGAVAGFAGDAAGLSIGLTAAGAEGSVPPAEGLPPAPGFSGSVGFSG